MAELVGRGRMDDCTNIQLLPSCRRPRERRTRRAKLRVSWPQRHQSGGTRNRPHGHLVTTRCAMKRFRAQSIDYVEHQVARHFEPVRKRPRKRPTLSDFNIDREVLALLQLD